MAIRAAIGQSSAKDPGDAASEAVQQAKLNLYQEKIDLAFVFSSIDIASPGLLKTIGLYLGDVPVVGCSSTAIITPEGISKHGLAIMLLTFGPGEYLTTACIKDIHRGSSLSAGEELGEKLLYGFREVRRDFSVIFSDGLIQEGSSLINGLQERLGSSFPLVGASASDNLRFLKTYLYFNQEIFNDGACGVMFGGKINFGLGVKHGWQPLGKLRTVTKSKGNTVYEIDGKIASDFYEDYFGCDLKILKQELKRISVLYPIGIHLAGEEEYLLRNILAIREDGSLVFQGDVPQASPIRLMIGTKESCLRATQEALEEAKRGMAGRNIDFVLIFDSISRYILLGREAAKELQIIKEGLEKNTPLIGLYTYGEQAPLRAMDYRGKAYFHNQAISVLAVGG